MLGQFTEQFAIVRVPEHRGYRNLLFARLISALGTWTAFFAVRIAIYNQTGSVWWVSILLFCELVPSVILGRFDPEKTLQAIHEFKTQTSVMVPTHFARLLALPDDLVARLEGKSSLGRLGLLIHSTAGFIDPGFSGHVTLELSNVATLPIKLWPGMKIGQLCLFRLSSPAEHPYGSSQYGSRYQGQRGPTPSRYYLNFRNDD